MSKIDETIQQRTKRDKRLRTTGGTSVPGYGDLRGWHDSTERVKDASGNARLKSIPWKNVEPTDVDDPSLNPRVFRDDREFTRRGQRKQAASRKPTVGQVDENTIWISRRELRQLVHEAVSVDMNEIFGHPRASLKKKIGASITPEQRKTIRQKASEKFSTGMKKIRDDNSRAEHVDDDDIISWKKKGEYDD